MQVPDYSSQEACTREIKPRPLGWAMAWRLRQREQTRERGPSGGVGGRRRRSRCSSVEAAQPSAPHRGIPAEDMSANGLSSHPASVSVPLSPAGGSPPSLSCRHSIKRTCIWGDGGRGRKGSPAVRSLAGPSPTWSSRREERTIHKWSELLATLFLLFFFQIWCL